MSTKIDYSVKGVNELYQHTLAIRREGHYDAVVFTNFPCLFCTDCTLKHHMEKEKEKYVMKKEKK